MIRQNPRVLPLWLDLEELVRFVTDRVPEQVRWPLVHFSADQWIELLYRGKGGRTSALRTFERWKQRARQLGVFRESDPQVLRWAPDAVYAIDGPAVSTEASKGAEEYEPPSPRRSKRGMSIKDIFASLGIGYSAGKIVAWHELGMPVRIGKRGKRMFYFGDSEEIERWISGAAARGLIQDPLSAKMPLEEAAPILSQVRSALGLSVKRMAGMVGTTPARLDSYLGHGTVPRQVPRALVEKAQALLQTPPPAEKAQLRAGSPPLEVIRRAFAQAGGKVNKASAILEDAGYTRGTSVENLRLLAIKYEIPYTDWSTRQVEMPEKAEMAQVLKAHKYRIRPTAQAIGISPTHFLRVLEEKFPDLYTLMQARRKKITDQDLVQAAEASDFNTGRAAELLDITRDSYRRLLNERGLADWFDEQSGRTASANPTEWPNRSKAIGWSWAPFRP